MKVMRMLMIRLMVRIHGIVIRIIHRIVIHPAHRAHMRKIVVRLRSVQYAVLLLFHVRTPLVAHAPTIMSESRLAVLVGTITVRAIRNGDLLQVGT